MCVCECVCVCMHACVCVHVYVCVCMCVCVCVHVLVLVPVSVLGCQHVTLLHVLPRKVRTQACLVTTTLTAVHRVTMARMVLEGISHYVQPHEGVEAAVGGGGVARVTYPVPAKNQVETKLWHNADCFLDSVAGLIHDEGVCQASYCD